jgi:hypothetical protein
VKARIKRGGSTGTDTLKLAVRIGNVPPEFDLTNENLAIHVTEDDEVYSVTIPAGTLQQISPRRFAFSDPTESLNGLRLVRFNVRGNGEGMLKVRTGRLDLSSADPTDHMTSVTLTAGTYDVTHTRLWEARANRLAIQ